MNKKWLPLALVILLGIILFVVQRFLQKESGTDKTSTTTEKKINRDRGFDRRISYLEYSNHASCRMDCRKISKAEVEQIMRDGTINYKKSTLDLKCPRYALEGRTNDGQKVRIVYAQCNEKTIVVTVIDLETEWICDCPGDDGSPSKSKN